MEKSLETGLKIHISKLDSKVEKIAYEMQELPSQIAVSPDVSFTKKLEQQIEVRLDKSLMELGKQYFSTLERSLMDLRLTVMDKVSVADVVYDFDVSIPKVVEPAADSGGVSNESVMIELNEMDVTQGQSAHVNGSSVTEDLSPKVAPTKSESKSKKKKVKKTKKNAHGAVTDAVPALLDKRRCDLDFINFKICIPENCAQDLLNHSAWPRNVRIRNWDVNSQRDGSSGFQQKRHGF